MDDLSGYIIFLFIPLAIFIVLMVHELGHMLVAKLFGFPIDEIEIGAGKQVWARTDKGGTLWRFRRYPVKAHVHVRGFDDDNRSLWQRFLIVLSGPLVNFIFPFFTFLTFFVLVGQPSTPPVLTGIEIGDAADQAGLRAGDQITMVDGVPVYRYADVKSLGYDPDRTSTYTVRRGDQTFDANVTPNFIEFIDINGIDRSYPRLGVIWRHKAFKFEAIHSVAGEVVEDDEDATRKALMQNFDRDIVIGFNSNDGNVRQYKVHLHSAANENINDEDDKDYDRIFIGAERDDFYYKGSLSQSVHDAFKFHTEMLGKVLKVPFQLFPIDKEAVTPAAAVEDKDSWFANGLYHFIYKMALISFVVAYVNLLPLPYLDGSYLLLYAQQALIKKRPTRKQHARIMALFFFAFYFSMMLANLDNIPRYIDSRIEKLHEFIDTKTAGEEDV